MCNKLGLQSSSLAYLLLYRTLYMMCSLDATSRGREGKFITILIA